MNKDSNKDSEDTRTYKLVAYGVEKAGVSVPTSEIIGSNFTLTFESYDTTRRLSEFDGVILFQGIFEEFTPRQKWNRVRYLAGDFDRNELDKRAKEINTLLEGNGFVCFLLRVPFIDGNERQDNRNYRQFDLAKRRLNLPWVSRMPYKTRQTDLKATRAELARFLDTFGAAWSYFVNLNKSIEWLDLARCGSDVTAMIIRSSEYFIPVLDPTTERCKEFFEILCEGLTSLHNKLRLQTPKWVNEFQFDHEASLHAKRKKLLTSLKDVETKIEELDRFKRVLVLSSERLVEEVRCVLEKGFRLRVDATDEYREDLKILDSHGRPTVLLEIKGTNSGVKRANVNQADDHRERAKLPPEFPSVLIMNTHIKNARTIEEKDQEIVGDQVVKAVNNNILILRTLDLLSLLKLHLADKLTREKFLKYLTQKKGWLRVTNGKIQILPE